MKKLLTVIVLLLCGLTGKAQEVMVIEKSNGNELRISVNEVKRVFFEQTTYHNGHEFVDLGLPSGTKWASCNVGASKPEEYGYYYAWGETTPKNSYSWDNYKWGSRWDQNITKYNIDPSCGLVDNKVVLELTDDAANVNWGGKWRMPTLEELTELITWSNIEETTLNGIAGFKFKSKMNHNYLFFPAGGWKADSAIYHKGSDAWYHTSSLMAVGNQMDCAYSLLNNEIDWGERDWGILVRPVYKE
jgi:hypothetical protein